MAILLDGREGEIAALESYAKRGECLRNIKLNSLSFEREKF